MLTEALKIFADEIIKRRSTIMTAGVGAGTIATFILTIRAGKKAEGKEGFEKVKPYILPGAVCAGTVVLNGFNEHCNVSDKKEAAIALAAVAKLYTDRRKAEKEIIFDDDPDKQKCVDSANAEIVHSEAPKDYHEGKQLYYDDFSQQMFYATPEWIEEAEVMTCEAYDHNDHLSANEFYNNLIYNGVEEIELLPEINRLGWAKWHIPKNDICPPGSLAFWHGLGQFADGTEYTIIKMFPEPELEYFGL